MTVAQTAARWKSVSWSPHSWIVPAQAWSSPRLASEMTASQMPQSWPQWPTTSPTQCSSLPTFWARTSTTTVTGSNTNQLALRM